MTIAVKANISADTGPFNWFYLLVTVCKQFCIFSLSDIHDATICQIGHPHLIVH